MSRIFAARGATSFVAMFCIRRLAFLAALFAFAPFLSAQQPGPTVVAIEFRWVGPETVSRQVIESNIQTQKGQPISEAKVEQDVRNLMATGYFLQVHVIEVDAEGGIKLIYELRGNSTIRQIAITGNKRISEDKLRGKLTIREGDTLDERKVHGDAQKLVEYYQRSGYQQAKVEHEISFDRETGKSVVTFVVEEGDKTLLQEVRFTGWTRAADGKLVSGPIQRFTENQLRKQMKTKKNWLFSWASGGGRLKEEQFEDDLERLREFYREHGYIDMDYVRNEANGNRGFRIERGSSPNRIIVTLDIFEGNQYKVGDIVIEGNKLFPTVELEKTLRMKSGDLFTPGGPTRVPPGGLYRDQNALLDYYTSRGYLNTDLRVIKSPNPTTGRMDLKYRLREGELHYVEKIVIRGNTKTRDNVIRRELAIYPGDVWNSQKIEASRDRLYGLGYFERVNMMPEQTDIPHHPDLAIEVLEQRTGRLSFGAGFSSIDNVLGFVEVQQGNFDLFGWPNFTGGGQKLRLRAQVGARRQDYTLNFTEPWFLNQRLSLGVDLFHSKADFYSTQYTESRTGGALRLEKALDQWWRASWRYAIENVELDVENTASAVLRAEDGRRTKSSMSFGLTRDARRFSRELQGALLTTGGNVVSGSAEVAGGPLGGNVHIYKIQFATTFYFPMLWEKHVLSLDGKIGVVDKWDKGTRVPLFDRVFLGGQDNIRGFEFNDVSLHDRNGESIGGQTFWYASTEYGFPLVERIRGVLFFDIGNVYHQPFSFSPGQDAIPGGGGFVQRKFVNAGAGFGFRFNLPIGLLKLDIGFPVIKDAANDHGVQFHFNIGYTF
jgi:outer membrane protein insertion porin family